MTTTDQNKAPTNLIFSKERLVTTTLINVLIISIATCLGLALDVLFKTENRLFLLLSIVFSFPVVLFFIFKKVKTFVANNSNK